MLDMTYLEHFGYVKDVAASLEDADDLLKEISDEAERIMTKAFQEFDEFLKAKGLENSMGVLCLRDDVKAIYHITDIEWDIDDEDVLNKESLREELEDDLNGYCIAGYITKAKMMKELEKFDKWLETAEVGDTFISYDDTEYTLELSVDLPTTVVVENLEGYVADYLSDTYDYCIKSYKVSVEIIDESEHDGVEADAFEDELTTIKVVSDDCVI